MQLRLARESIQMQSPIFFKELTLAVNELRKLPKKEIETSKEANLITNTIKHHTNLISKLDFADFGPAVSFNQITKNHPLVDALGRYYSNNKDILRLISSNKELRGLVDLKNSKVDGFFRDMGVVFYLPLSMLAGTRFTDEEIAAGILHEVGHVFTYCEYITRSVSTNQVLAAMSRDLADAETEKDREVILINVKTALGLKTESLRELSKTTNTKVVEAVVVSAVVEETRSELGSDIYDSCSWEYLCDEFAARHGAGKHLITALDKIYRDYGHISFRSTPSFIAYEAFKLVLFSVSFIPGGVFVLPIALLLIAADGHNEDYDMPGARMVRVKNQIIENLKDKRLPKIEIEILQEDLRFINSLIKEVEDRRQFFGVLGDWLSPSARRNRDFKIMQQELEALANNDLFAKASEFKLTL